MARPRSNELARSGHTPLGEHFAAKNADTGVPLDDGHNGPVPPHNQPGHRPEVDQDKPIEAFAERFPAVDCAMLRSTPEQHAATVSGRLRLGSGFAAAERPDIVERLSSLDNALAAFLSDAVELELSTKDRDRPGQATTLQCWLTGWPRLVSTSSQQALTASLVEVRDDLRRQLDDVKARNAPQRNRQTP